MSTSPDAETPLPTRAEALPTRVPQARAGGRHRRPEIPAILEGAPPLVLAVPGPADADLDDVVREIALLARAGRPGLDVRPVFLGAGATDLTPVLGPVGGTAEAKPDDAEADVEPADGAEEPVDGEPLPEPVAEGVRNAVVVPLLIGPHPEAEARVRATVEAAEGRELTVTEALGPHPLLAEALHERLSEAGLARADRARLFTVVTAADGIILATTGGPAALQAADMTGVLLAARLALPVVTADLEVPGAVGDAATRLRQMGAERIALAPYVLGPDLDPDLIETAAAHAEVTASAPLGAHGALGKLVLQAYLAAAGIQD